MSAPSTLDRRTGTLDAIRLMNGPWHRATLLRLANGRWGIYDTEEHRLSKLTFQQPTMARDKFDELFPDAAGRLLSTTPTPPRETECVA